MRVRHKFLFNFSASYSTGGYKRLYEYAKWFNQNGGAWFIINPRCAVLTTEFPHNKFFIISQSRIARLYDDCGYLGAIAKEIGEPELYYSYGIPLYSRFGRISWFHLSNVLPLSAKSIPLPVFERLKISYLGRRIRAGLIYANVISAESRTSIAMFESRWSEKLFLSVNGSDDELAAVGKGDVSSKEEVATVVGTAAYKKLEDSFRIFETLKKRHCGLKLVVVGNRDWIPRTVRNKGGVVIRGLVSRPDVIACLQKSMYYISTTCAENSYNAAAEGVFLANTSYISDIGPHRELLENEPVERVSMPGLSDPLLQVTRSSLSGVNLRTWDGVIVEMIGRAQTTAMAPDGSM